MVAGTVATAKKMLVGQIDPNLSATAAAHQVIGALAVGYDKFVSALMLLPTEALSLVLTDKNKLLDQLRGYIVKVGRTLGELTSSDYGYDHQTNVRKVIEMLREAESNVATANNILLQGGNFLEGLWRTATKKVDDASVILYDPKTLVPPINSRQVNIAGFLLSINATLQVLLCRQAAIERIYNNLASFSSDFQTYAKFDNLFAPILDQVSCLLLATIQDMEAALNKNAAFAMIMKEKEWLIQLRTILVFMRNAKAMSSVAKTSQAAQDYSYSFAVNASTDNNTNDFTALVNLINELKTQTAAAMMMPPKNPQRIAKIIEAILVEIDRQKAITSRTEERLSSFSRTAFTDDLTEAFTVANSLIAFALSRNLVGIAKALKEGDVRSLFKSAFQCSDEEKALGGFVDLIQYAKKSLPEEVPALVQGYEAMRARVRSDALFSRLVSTSADRYIRDQKENRLPENSALERLMNRITKKIGLKSTVRGAFGSATDTLSKGMDSLEARIASIQNRIDSVGGILDTGLEQAIGVVTRPTQTKPVSCSSR